MSDLMITFFILTFLLTLTFGFLQTSTELPDSQAETGYTTNYSALGVLTVCFQAIVSISIYAGTPLFPVAAVIVALTLLCHHAIIHRHSRFEGEVYSCAFFQVKDVSNHETWVVASLVAALISLLHV